MRGQLSPLATATELTRLNERAHVPQTTEPTCPGARIPELERKPERHNWRENPNATTGEKTRMPQLEKSPCITTKSPGTAVKKIPYVSTSIPHATNNTQRSQKNKENK